MSEQILGMQVGESEVILRSAVVRSSLHAARLPLQTSATPWRNALWSQSSKYKFKTKPLTFLCKWKLIKVILSCTWLNRSMPYVCRSKWTNLTSWEKGKQQKVYSRKNYIHSMQFEPKKSNFVLRLDWIANRSICRTKRTNMATWKKKHEQRLQQKKDFYACFHNSLVINHAYKKARILVYTLDKVWIDVAVLSALILGFWRSIKILLNTYGIHNYIP